MINLHAILHHQRMKGYTKSKHYKAQIYNQGRGMEEEIQDLSTSRSENLQLLYPCCVFDLGLSICKVSLAGT